MLSLPRTSPASSAAPGASAARNAGSTLRAASSGAAPRRFGGRTMVIRVCCGFSGLASSMRTISTSVASGTLESLGDSWRLFGACIMRIRDERISSVSTGLDGSLPSAWSTCWSICQSASSLGMSSSCVRVFPVFTA